MNYLAHLLLSPREKDFISGNMAADFLRGCNRKLISKSIQKGIAMHQFVDNFTDTHLLVKTSKNRITNHFRLLSGVFVDVFYDHFLAKDFENFANIPLEEFCEYIYGILENNIDKLPPRLQQFVPIMVSENVLLSYRKLEGVQNALTKINRRISIKFSVKSAMTNLKNVYKYFGNDFMRFLPCLIDATRAYRKGYGSFLLR